MPAHRKYTKKDRPVCVALIGERSLHNTTLDKIKDIFKDELGIVVSLPTISHMRAEVQSGILEHTATVAAQAHEQILKAVVNVDGSKFVEILDNQIKEMYGCLYDELYAGPLIRPRNYGERMRMEAELRTCIQNLLGIVGPPPKPPDESYGGLIPKRDVLALMEEREEQYKTAFLEYKVHHKDQLEKKPPDARVPKEVETAPTCQLEVD